MLSIFRIKIAKNLSNVSESSDSLCAGSQQSSYSNNSEVRKKLLKSERLIKTQQIKKIESLFSELELSFPPLLCPVKQQSTSKVSTEQARQVAELFTELCTVFLVGSDFEGKNKFLSKVIDELRLDQTENSDNIQLSIYVLDSLKEYIKLISGDTSRDGILAKKVFYESVTGTAIRNGNLISQLGVNLNARKATLLECAKSRAKLEEDEKLIPILSRLARKPPEGEKIISDEWLVKVARWYTSDSISDIIKGHNNVKKETYSKQTLT